MIHLSKKILSTLRESKNLLAFSAGVDSTALFFLLKGNNIVFDIAMVNYGLRKESIEEERYAIGLAKRYNLKIYVKKAPIFQRNFEKNARDFRYSFFEEIIDRFNYNTLITAHQLNDQLEWLLMRLSKGAGLNELLGLEEISERKNYRLVRPILTHSKDELIDYLKRGRYKYFIDSSNMDEKYERNYFRNRFSDELIYRYKSGIKKSFDYLKEDKEILLGEYREIFNHKLLYVLEMKNSTSTIRLVDKYLKKMGYLLSSAQRNELKKNSSMVFGGQWSVELRDNKIYIAPYVQIKMPKKFKEKCRISKIPQKIRGYIYKERLEPQDLVFKN